jgi:AcrR family transcriptional regulator
MACVTTTAPHEEEPPQSLREANKRRRVIRILDAVLALIREDRDRVPTVEQIAVRAGVSAMTVFNLVGTREEMWEAAVGHALRDLDLEQVGPTDPHERARAIVIAAVRALCADAAVFRGLLATWQGDALRRHDPTSYLIACFVQARDEGMVGPIDPRVYGEVVATGLLGAISQWTSGLIGDRALRARALAMVDIAFAAAAAE